MFDIGKDQSFASRGIPLGILEVNYPAEGCGRAALHALVERELAALRERYADYDRKAVFGENPYFRFFRKFKKTYPDRTNVVSSSRNGTAVTGSSSGKGRPLNITVSNCCMTG